MRGPYTATQAWPGAGTATGSCGAPAAFASTAFPADDRLPCGSGPTPAAAATNDSTALGAAGARQLSSELTHLMYLAIEQRCRSYIWTISRIQFGKRSVNFSSS